MEGKKTTKTQKNSGNTKVFPIVGVGASAGGLEAFKGLLKNLPDKISMSFVFIQHLSPKYESSLTEILSRETKIPVCKPKNNEIVKSGHIYIIPNNKDIHISKGRLKLTKHVTVGGQHLPIDYFFNSLSKDQGSNAIGVILSGTASDGVAGIKKIKTVGGTTFAQDEVTAKYSGMPHNAVESGFIDFVLTPEEIADQLVKISLNPHEKIPIDASKNNMIPNDLDAINKIFLLLRKNIGVDFSHYKRSTINRRVHRRMVLNKIENIEGYVKFLQRKNGELGQLHNDLLINVTRFFRDPMIYEVLKKKIFPSIIKARIPGKPIRIWVPGCSTGEEVYSIMISFMQSNLFKESEIPIQLFGSDISEVAIKKARAGIYPENIKQDVGDKVLKRFFDKIDGGYRIKKSIREHCIFAKHDVTKDPPFSRIDLISCRNLLIYLDPMLQKKVIPTFHYALKPDGFLLLGSSEGINNFSKLFSFSDRKNNIYKKKYGADYFDYKFDSNYFSLFGELEDPQQPVIKSSNTPFSPQDEVEYILLNKYAPTSLLIDENMEILRFWGYSSLYLEHTTGKASLNLMKVLRSDLSVKVSQAIQEALKRGIMVKLENISFKHHGNIRRTDIEVIPIKDTVSDITYFFLIFEGESPETVLDEEKSDKSKISRKPGLNQGEKEKEIARLQIELEKTGDYLQSVIERQETTNEELKSSLEELQSSNEELQSTNEELETAKEELQSTNEELATLNEELDIRNLELSRYNNDLTNILGSIDTPIVIVGDDLNIRRFNSTAKRILNVLPGDVGRKFTDISLKINIPDIEEKIIEVIETLKVKDMEVQDSNGCWFSVRIKPYLTQERKIDGVVITANDIDKIKKINDEINEAREYSESIIQTLREPIIILNKDMEVVSANKSFYQKFRTKRSETENKKIYRVADGQWNTLKLKNILDNVLPKKKQFKDVMVDFKFKKTGEMTAILNGRQLVRGKNKPPLILISLEDVTHRMKAENALRKSEQRYRSYIELTEQLSLTTNPNGEVEEDLPEWRRYTGQTIEQIKGMGWTNAIHPEDKTKTLKSLKKALKKKTNFQGEFRIKGHNGEYRHFLIRCVPIYSSKGHIQEWVGTCIDFTDRKKNEERIKVLARFPAENPYPVLRVSEKGMLIYANAESKIILQDDRIDTGGSIFTEWKKIVKNVLKNNSREIIQKKFKDKYYLFVFTPIIEARYVNIYGFDITDKIKAEQEMMRMMEANSRLSEKFQKNANELDTIFKSITEPVMVYSRRNKIEKFNEAAIKSVGTNPTGLTVNNFMKKIRAKHDDGRKFDAMKTLTKLSTKGETIKDVKMRFTDIQGNEKTILVSAAPIKINKQIASTAIVWHDITEFEKIEELRRRLIRDLSHQLKTPLVVIEMSAQHLLSKIEEYTEVDSKILDMILKNTSDMRHLISKILLLSKIESGDVKIIIKKFNLSHKIMDILDNIRPLAEKKKLKVTTHIPDKIIVKSDEGKITDAISNILENAVKYTEKGGISINLQKEKNTIKIIIKDTGRGMTQIQLKNIFTRFYKADPSVTGTGLGLNIALENIKLLGGSITAESNGMGKGSVFTIKLPTGKK